MLTIRPTTARGLTQLSWLGSRHTFSFGEYYDPQHKGFHTLRVINQDIVQPGGGFATHSHKDMEIITYVLKGAVVHKDSMGNETIIRPGEIQLMSAGTGVTHSEYNYSKTELLEFLQIWILPAQKNLMPGYQQSNFDYNKMGLQLLVSPDNADGVLLIHQQAKLWRGLLTKQQELALSNDAHKSYWLQIISGTLLLNNQLLNPGDGVAIINEDKLTLVANEQTEFLLFELH